MPKAYALRVVTFEQPTSWRWRHNRVNVVIVRLDSDEYLKYQLTMLSQGGPRKEPLIHPLRPNKIIANVHWAKMGIMHARYKEVLDEAIRICSRLEKRGNIIEWGVYGPLTKERTTR